MSYRKETSPFNPFRPSNGWWSVSVCFSAATVLLGFGTYTFSLFSTALTEEYGWTRTQINISLSFSAFGLLVGPLVGRAIDKRGPRIVMTLFLLLTSISFLLRPMMTEVWHWYALSFIQFIGLTSVMTPVGRVVGLWFSKNRGRVIGISMMGNNFGGVIMPAAIGFIVSSHGWHNGYYAQAIITAIAAGFTFIALREPPLENDAIKAGSSAQIGNNRSKGVSVHTAFRSKHLYLTLLIFMVGSLPFAALIPQLIAHYVNEGISLTKSTMALSLLASSGMAGKIIFGFMAEKITARTSMLISFSGLSIALLLASNLSIPTMVWICSPLWGICMGSFGTLSTMILQDYFGIKNLASIAGISNYGTLVSFGVGPVVAGLIYDSTDSYRILFYMTVLLLMTGLVAVKSLGAKPNLY